MVVYKVFKLGVLVVLIFVLLAGLTASAQSKEENTETRVMDQSSTAEENEYATHVIVLRNDEFSPKIIEINQHDTVIWRNLNRPKNTFVLESDDNLWKDFSLGYGRSFEYTFDEAGDFDFSIKGEKGMDGTVVVRESKETAVSPAPEKETRQAEQGVQEETTETTEMYQSSTSKEKEYASQTYTIVLRNDEFSPKLTEINQYDTVMWRNLNKPKRTFVLVSDDNLWEDFSLGYGRSFEYTFNETGNFGFSIEGEKGLEGTVVVKESKETAVAPTPEKETRQAEQGVTEQKEEEVTPAPVEKVITPTDLVQVSEKSVVIRGSVFYPEALTLNKGETLVWKNLNKPKHLFTLISDDELFEDQAMGYGRSFSYTFKEAGNYVFKLKEATETKLIVTVK